MFRRTRRLRYNQNIRNLVRETTVSKSDLIYPMFVTYEKGIKQEIESMPGNYRYGVDIIAEAAKEYYEMGIPAIILFGIPETKDEMGTSSWSELGVVQQAVSSIKKEVPELVVITDVCLCEYTSHGHCGVIKDNTVDNDATLALLSKQALSHAAAGADMVAPSDMMDGRVGVIRETLDKNDFINIPIMAYSAKYASAFYGPFRDAAKSTPSFGDRKSYQMDSANRREAIKEIEIDISEGADIVMVKPALAYLDIIREAKDIFNTPVAAYNVSGEFSMVKAAASKGWIDEKKIVLEIITSIKRAGADLILTYHAPDLCTWLD